MLFAFAEEVHPAVWTSGGAIVGAAIAAAGRWMVSLYRTHRVENRADAQSVIEEWREIHSRDEERIGQLIASVELLNAKVEALQREHMSCEIRCSQMAAKITLLESAIHAAGNKPPAAT